MAITCAAGEVACGGVCTSTRANPNCGACGVSCKADQVCDQGACKSVAAGCSMGLAACAGSCVDLQVSPTNCGACGTSCDAGKVCTAGVCSCMPGQTACGSSCVNVATDNSNCGTCGNACSGGRTCAQGACTCPAGSSFCGDACVDTTTSAQNCGACGTVCGAGKVCTAGQCACAAGQVICGDACVDVQTSDANCGACGQACSLGQVCAAGQCGGGGGVREDGCSGLAQGISVSQVAIYQTVKIPIMQMGTDVPPAMRNVDVVAGRDALLRVFTTVASGWTARQLSARVFLQNGTTIETLYAKRSVAGSTMEGDLATSFQIPIPKDKLTRETRYAIEIVECGGMGTGGVLLPRYPASEGSPLGARATGPLKVRLIPLQTGAMMPDTTEAGLKAYKELFTATYPVSGVEFTVGDPLPITSATDWTGNLDRVRSRRQSDAPAADVYYYGLLRPTASLREFCSGGCTTGIGYVPGGSGNNQAAQRAALGIGFGDAASADTMAHEVAHNHGRQHAPCGGVSGADANFPYMGGAIGVYGYDARTQRLMAPDRTDIMGYCQNKWFSDYTYKALLTRIATLNMAQASYVPGPSAEWRVLLLDASGPRWGIPLQAPAPAGGDPESAQVLDVFGNVIKTVTVYRTEISDIHAASYEVPPPEAGWHSVKIGDHGAYPYGAPTMTPLP